jgi:hypothetical protein
MLAVRPYQTGQLHWQKRPKQEGWRKFMGGEALRIFPTQSYEPTD